MAISQDKVRTIITIPKDLKKKLEKIAKQDNRSFNNLVIPPKEVGVFLLFSSIKNTCGND